MAKPKKKKKKKRYIMATEWNGRIKTQLWRLARIPREPAAGNSGEGKPREFPAIFEDIALY